MAKLLGGIAMVVGLLLIVVSWVPTTRAMLDSLKSAGGGWAMVSDWVLHPVTGLVLILAGLSYIYKARAGSAPSSPSISNTFSPTNTNTFSPTINISQPTAVHVKHASKQTVVDEASIAQRPPVNKVIDLGGAAQLVLMFGRDSAGQSWL
jgi:hypothetical protein